MTTYEERLKRIRTAVSLEPVDKTPLVTCGTSFNAKACGVKLADYLKSMRYNCTVNLQATEMVGGIDGVQFPIYSAEILPILWLSEVKVPGRSQGVSDDEVWQVNEKELIKSEDYDQILSMGFTKWVMKFWRERLDHPLRRSIPYFLYLKRAMRRFQNAGYPCMSISAMASPFEMLCGGRSLETFFCEDLLECPDKMEKVFKAAQAENLKTYARMLDLYKPLGIWVGGWRGTPSMLSSDMFERFCWPYLEELALLCISKGVTPVFHLDSCWDRGLGYFNRLPKGKCIMALDGTTDIRKAKEIAGDRTCIMGDVPATLLAYGTENDVYEYCRNLIRDIGPKGFILSSGCDMPPNAKVENVKVMGEACKG